MTPYNVWLQKHSKKNAILGRPTYRIYSVLELEVLDHKVIIKIEAWTACWNDPRLYNSIISVLYKSGFQMSFTTR